VVGFRLPPVSKLKFLVEGVTVHIERDVGWAGGKGSMPSVAVPVYVFPEELSKSIDLVA
jgi:hypothetical protein